MKCGKEVVRAVPSGEHCLTTTNRPYLYALDLPSYFCKGWSWNLQIVYIGKPYQVLARGWQTTTDGRGQGHVTHFNSFGPHHILWLAFHKWWFASVLEYWRTYDMLLPNGGRVFGVMRPLKILGSNWRYLGNGTRQNERYNGKLIGNDM